MAIVTTRFSAEQGADLNVIKQWFEENASDYFDEVIIQDDILLLKSAGETILEYIPKGTSGNTASFVFHTAGGDTAAGVTPSATTPLYINRLTRTDSGIAAGLFFSTKSYEYGIFITRDKNGDIACVFSKTLGVTTVSDYKRYYILSRSSTRTTDTFDIVSATFQAEYTCLTNAVCSCAEDYLPDCFITPFSQYAGVPCIFELDGVKYIYNGYVALKD